MFLKIVSFIGVLAAVGAQNHYGAHNEVQHDAGHYHHDEEHHGPAHYEYHYDVHDEHTGDVHGQHEARKDDHTHGEYYLIDADGHKRTIIVVLAVIASVSAQSHYGHQQHHQPQQYHHEEEHGPVHYEYHYDVHDDHTGDVHGQREARKDDSTQGEYYLIDADGHKRTVKYHVEGKSGFIAEVQREPIKGYQAPQPQHHYQPQYHHEAPTHHNYQN
ncbi:hypothetical protein ZHAS_00010132 [Anopheles sinensis]|uniref:Uncharacterized protein n=1 Tax=Anopheles sinensis TaxID=74873 RepID=A0A084VWT9_ANOSI|nr:hypothetical protein ZHAS_00010132 [Anopheles sinensis]